MGARDVWEKVRRVIPSFLWAMHVVVNTSQALQIIHWIRSPWSVLPWGYLM